MSYVDKVKKCLTKNSKQLFKELGILVMNKLVHKRKTFHSF